MPTNYRAYVLSVDDEPLNCEILSEFFDEFSQDYELNCVSNGLQCLQIIRRRTPDVILLDMRMPGLSGLEVCRTLRKSNNYKDIPIIFLSASASPEEQAIGLAAGADAYITKPFDFTDLIINMEQLLACRNVSLMNQSYI